MIDAKKIVKMADEIRHQAAELRARTESLHVDFSRIIASMKKKNGGTLHIAN